MRRLRIWLLCALSLTDGARLWAGESAAEELGHHWSNPTYTGELRLQMLCMVAILALAALWALGRRALHVRGRGL